MARGRGRGRGKGRGRGQKRGKPAEIEVDHDIPNLDNEEAGQDQKKIRFETDSSDFESEDFLRDINNARESEESEQNEVEVNNQGMHFMIT